MADRAPARDDGEFLAHFDAAAIPREEWGHRAFLRVAYLELRARALPDAVRRIRRGVQRLERAQGVGAGDPRGYHETLSLAWARLVGAALADVDPAADFDSFIAVHPELLALDRVLQHYSRERLASRRARLEFVLPDRDPLPHAEPSTGSRAD